MQPRARLLTIAGAVVAFSLLAALGADASSSAIARFGTRGAARLTSGGPNTVYVNLKNLANGSWTEVLYKGTCATPGARIRTLPVLTVAGGIVRRTDTISVSQARVALTGVLRIARGTTAYCAPFGTAVIAPTASPSPSRSSSPPGTSPSPSASASATASQSASATASAAATAAATGTAQPTGSAATCPPNGSYACVGDTLEVVFGDGKPGTLMVESATRSAPSSGNVTLDVLVSVKGPAGEDATYDWMVGDINGKPGMFAPTAGAPSPRYPTYTNASGVARGWLRFVIPASFSPYLTTPGPVSVRLP